MRGKKARRIRQNLRALNERAMKKFGRPLDNYRKKYQKLKKAKTKPGPELTIRPTKRDLKRLGKRLARTG
jgi:hypothetical protein